MMEPLKTREFLFNIFIQFKSSNPLLYVNPSAGMRFRTNQEKPGLQISCFITHVEFVYQVIA